ncbi:glycosyltransferase [Mucilaginibacter lacusdianchii]|uniref:glycosyltransferase n=1 Tax=Mucilaginibacter lacusdianchii TaxID=2684211 RepID=UPI00131C39FC|nr:glycosyltransferase [Mucilaginibacter sp. JXJ CY 39]
MEDKKNIVVFTNTLLSGGAEKQALLLASALHKTHRVLLVIYHGQKVEQKFLDIIVREHLHVVYLSGNAVAKTLAFYKLLRKYKVDIIFSYLLTTNLIGALIGRLAGVKYRVGGIRNAQLDPKKLPIQRFINNHLNTHTIFNNYTGLQSLKTKGFNDKNAVVISNGFELNGDVLTRADKKPINIITVGRFVQQKGYFIALEVMRALQQAGENFNYTIIGYGELESQIHAEIIALQLQDCVQVVINPTNINAYYESADIYLCTSFFEGLSNTVMEALSFSLPVVASNVGDNNLLVEHGRNGFIVQDMEYKSFIEPIKLLINSSKVRNIMGHESFKIIRDIYGMEAFEKKYLDFIQRCDMQLA